MKYDNIISLGNDCHIALELQKRNLINKSLPFDYLVSNYFKSINTLLENRFENLWQYAQIHEDDEVLPDTRRLAVYDEYYKVLSIHDFLHNNIQETLDKYKRRIDRLYDIIENQDNILFMRLESVYYDYDEFERFNNIIKSIRSKPYEVWLLGLDEFKPLPINYKYICMSDWIKVFDELSNAK